MKVNVTFDQPLISTTTFTPTLPHSRLKQNWGKVSKIIILTITKYCCPFIYTIPIQHQHFHLNHRPHHLEGRQNGVLHLCWNKWSRWEERRRKASKKTGPNHAITTTFDLVENLNNDHDQINIIIAKVTIKVFLFIFLSPDFLSHFSFFLFKHHTFPFSLSLFILPSLLNMVPWFWWITQTLKYLNRPGPNGWKVRIIYKHDLWYSVLT